MLIACRNGARALLPMPQLRLPASLAPLVFTPSRRGYDFFLTWPYLVLQYFRSIFPNGQEHARLQPGQMCESTTIPDPAALAQLSSRSCSSLPLVVPNQLSAVAERVPLPHLSEEGRSSFLWHTVHPPSCSLPKPFQRIQGCSYSLLSA